MEFRRFIASVILIQCQVVITARQIVQRVLSWSEWVGPLMRAHAKMRALAAP